MEGNMAISYSGLGAQITDSLADALTALTQGKQPNNLPFSSGSIAIRPVGVGGNFSTGNFSIVADDDPTQLLPYRFIVTTQLDSPCKALEDELFSANQDYISAIHEGVNKTLIARLKAVVDKLRKGVATCLATNGIQGEGFGGQTLVFRSRDLLRTGNGKFDSGLLISVLVLTNDDLRFLGGIGVNLPTPVSFEEIVQLARSSAPPNITINNASAESGLLRIDFSHSSPDLTGHITVSPRPSLTPDFLSYIGLDLVDLNLDGISGWLALCFGEDEIRAQIQNGLNDAAASMNSTIALAVQNAEALLPASLSNPQLTLTLLNVSVGLQGISATPALGLLLNSKPDPCQSLRDDLRDSKLELSAAIHDHESQQEINKLNERITAQQKRLNACLAANA
jgi:hypothetical protein